MKLSGINLDSLRDGTYYYCAICEHWFGELQPTPNQQCPDCPYIWKNARGIYTKESHTTLVGPTPSAPEKEPKGTGLVIVFVVLAVGYWGYTVVVQPMFVSAWRQTQIVWSNTVEGVGVGLGFIGSLLLSLVVLTIATLLLFVLFRYLIYLIVLMFLAFATVFATGKYQPPLQYRANKILKEHSFLAGTLINLISSYCALLIASWIFQRPPDYWDFGIQFLIALLIEIVVFGTS